MNTSVPVLHTCMYTCMRMLLCLHTPVIRCTPSSMSSMIIQYVITLLFITGVRIANVRASMLTFDAPCLVWHCRGPV